MSTGDAPLVSLVMAAWKPRADWFLTAVRSALDQRGCELELVVVDDGSPEPVERLLEPIDDTRLRVVRVEHGGEPRARNAGIAAARGEYVRFVDADDALDPDSTAHLLGLERGDGVIAYGATAICDSELRPIWTMTSRLQGWVAAECLLGRWTVRVPSLLWPRRVVDAAGEWDASFRVSHDWDWVLRALEHAPVRGDARVATYYRKHASSATSDTGAGEEGARRVVDRYFERHPEQRGTSLERRAEAMLAALQARVRASRGRRSDAVAPLVRALRLDPTAVVREVARSTPALVGTVKRRFVR